MKEKQRAACAAPVDVTSDAKLQNYLEIDEGKGVKKVLNVSPDALSDHEEKHLPLYNVIPEIQGFVKKLAEVYQVDVDFCTSTIYSAVAAVLGSKITLRDPRGFANTPALWLCHVAPSGYGKSPVEAEVLRPLVGRQAQLRARYKAQMHEWEQKKEGSKPRMQRVIVSDSTPEALYQALEDNPDGLLLYRDELSGWPADFGRYNQSGEIDTLLSIWSAKAIDTHRLTREGNFVEDPCLNVFGGTQPDRLQKVWGKDVFMCSGFDARILWVYPAAEGQLEYNATSLPPSYKKWWNDFIAQLYDLAPREVTLSRGAKRIYIEYWEGVQTKKIASDAYMAAIYAKLQIYAEKWALISHMVSEVNMQADFALAEIDEQSMSMAVEAMNMFEAWAQKVYNKMYAQQTPKLTKAQIIRLFNEYFPIRNKQQFADSLGVSRPLISRALCGGDVTPQISQNADKH